MQPTPDLTIFFEAPVPWKRRAHPTLWQNPARFRITMANTAGGMGQPGACRNGGTSTKGTYPFVEGRETAQALSEKKDGKISCHPCTKAAYLVRPRNEIDDDTERSLHAIPYHGAYAA